MTETEKYESKNRTLLIYVLFVFCSVFFMELKQTYG